jgi:hypothetical protein
MNNSGKHLYAAVLNPTETLVIGDERNGDLKTLSWLTICPANANVSTQYTIQLPSIIDQNNEVDVICTDIAWTLPENATIGAGNIKITCNTGKINITALN